MLQIHSYFLLIKCENNAKDSHILSTKNKKGGTKISVNIPGHMTKMAALPMQCICLYSWHLLNESRS